MLRSGLGNWQMLGEAGKQRDDEPETQEQQDKQASGEHKGNNLTTALVLFWRTEQSGSDWSVGPGHVYCRSSMSGWVDGQQKGKRSTTLNRRPGMTITTSAPPFPFFSFASVI